MKKIYKFIFLFLLLLLVGCEYNPFESHKVIFDANGGDLTSNEYEIVEHGMTVDMPSYPTREGYSFEGWFLKDKIWNFEENIVTKRITLKAKWSINEYTIRVEYNDGKTAGIIVNKKYGEKIDIEKDLDNFLDKKLEKEGYYSYEWSQTNIPETMPANDLYIEPFYLCQIRYDIENEKVGVTGVNCDSENIVILDSYWVYPTTKICNYAFHDCTNIKNITLPNTIICIENGAFSGCKKLNNIEIPNSVTRIGDFAFEDCKSLTSIKIPDSVTSMGKCTFWHCINLTDVVLSNNLESIDTGTFYMCTSLTNITIPKSVKNIDSDAFITLRDLNITFNGTKEEWNKINFGKHWDAYIDSYTVHCTDGDIIK